METRAAHKQFWALFLLTRDFSGFWRSPFLVLFVIKWTSSWGFPTSELKKNNNLSSSPWCVAKEPSVRKKNLKLWDNQKKFMCWRAIQCYQYKIVICLLLCYKRFHWSDYKSSLLHGPANTYHKAAWDMQVSQGLSQGEKRQKLQYGVFVSLLDFTDSGRAVEEGT